ncbi:aldose 1-epimerase family protein [Caviibacter abscessus]|uniref:aldose 1-epimerase family protein n=1 Tax=Caviibacter abscessus TaxID=1766719 RepID=UPI00082C9447|nr:aldose 1-epimerase family protein [Caviibacter abscessus]
MNININSNKMKVAVLKKGAELKSIVIDDEEYMWNEKEIWAKTSPILFPFIGKLKDNSYTFKNKRYTMDTRHGFARDMDFKVVSHLSDSVKLELKSSEETKKVYPFDFNFQLEYKIISDNTLKMSLIVENLGKDDMYFSLGAHPAFKLSDDYYNWNISFENEKELYTYKLSNGYYLDEKIYIGKKSIINIIDENFKDDAIILDGDGINKTTIENDKKQIIIEHKGFKYIAYWKPEKAKFICVEPWFGITDNVNHNGKIEDKIGIIKLGSKKIFESNIFFTFKKKVK